MLSDNETHELWSAAGTFEALCSLMRRFIDGELACTPEHLGPLDPESLAIAEKLMRLNACGFLTTCSQPGESSQRAFVYGFCLDGAADRLKVLAMRSDLVIMLFPPNRRDYGGHPIHVTVDHGEVFTMAGLAQSEDDIRECWPPAAADILCAAWQVSIIDPAWGKEERLWWEVSEALQAQLPSPTSTDQSHDFCWPDFQPATTGSE